MEDSSSHAYDLEDRLLHFGARIIVLNRTLNGDYAERYIGKQLLRSGTSPLSNHGEAQAAESNADFIHKMKLALNLDETDQLIRIFVTSISTAAKRRKP